uniref:NAD(P)H-quinone oxidoreductase subunit 5, chloroplastic n=1 Tax=Austroblechnum melanocaulon TaxID=1329983 RepID=A0A248R9K3_9MONI|nr:NADH-plastoquinone oxidoreductase subunit 5 [Austroblechnum melanocaulon]ASU94128.1 NADH-plastoquinone oxidoreductase subunit 5 [Austroblechnum melanocaulon]
MPVELSNRYACFIPLCPLVAARSTGSLPFFFPKATRSLRRLCAAFNTFSSITAMSVSSALFRQQTATHSIQQFLWARIPKSDFRLKIGFLIDPLTLAMSVLVTTVGISAMVYSDSYMCHDQGYARFYAYLSLSTASMLGLVFSPNLIQIYVFWELVGMCSYLLIGFWFARSSAAKACQKAFVTNRIGDFGLLLGVSGVYWVTGSFEIFELCDRFFELSNTGVINPIFANTIALPPFLGPVAKSAQFPLHVWLPDATEGPTPISALIHAATMVAAGISSIARIFNLISILPPAMCTISWVGGVTALPGAMSALAQKDMKRGLAYSTMSQLGYMVPASGIGASRPALFHLITHAYSKALSFLGSGSVIHSMEKVVGYSPTKSQNMSFMGGLRKHMPITATTFLLGTLSLCGIPPLSRFWSKDLTITESWLRSPYLGLITSITAGLTAFYTSRIYLLTFEGNFRANQISNIGFDTSLPSESIITPWDGARAESPTTQTIGNATYITDMERNGVAEAGNLVIPRFPEGDPICEEVNQIHSEQNLLYPQESNFCMVLPLVVLAIPTAFAGLAGVDPTQRGIGLDLLFDWLISIPSFYEINKHLENLTEILISSTPSLSLSLSGLVISFIAYGRGTEPADTKVFENSKLINKGLLDTLLFFVRDWSVNRGYIDYYYGIYPIRGMSFVSKLVLHFDQWVIDGFVNGIGVSSFLSGEISRYGKNGRISHYLLGLVIGIILPVLLAASC